MHVPLALAQRSGCRSHGNAHVSVQDLQFVGPELRLCGHPEPGVATAFQAARVIWCRNPMLWDTWPAGRLMKAVKLGAWH